MHSRICKHGLVRFDIIDFVTAWFLIPLVPRHLTPRYYLALSKRVLGKAHPFKDLDAIFNSMGSMVEAN